MVGLPHEKWGDEVTAFVILKDSCQATELELKAFCRKNMAAYKAPKKIVFMESQEMPRTGTGKILHRILRERFA